MLLSVGISTWTNEWKGLTEEAYKALQEKIPQLPKEKPEYYHKDLVVDTDGVRALSQAGLTVELRPADDNCMLVKLQDRMEALGLEVRDLQSAVANGCAAQIHIPDLGLMRVDEVTWLDDACTERLQEELDDGWRILAVCPPNAQRRPDYTLGRVKQRQER